MTAEEAIAIRKSLKFTQREWAAALGVSRALVLKFEKHGPSEPMARAIERFKLAGEVERLRVKVETLTAEVELLRSAPGSSKVRDLTNEVLRLVAENEALRETNALLVGERRRRTKG